MENCGGSCCGSAASTALPALQRASLIREAFPLEWLTIAWMEINGPLYYSSLTVLAAIDGMALLLTGQRDYFHLRGHGRRVDVG